MAKAPHITAYSGRRGVGRLTQSRCVAFSLVEVVLAMGVASFCLVALLGLYVVGIKSGKESGEDIQGANLASLLIAQRRANPTNASPVFSSALPLLSVSSSNLSSPLYLTASGMATNQANAAYRFTYIIETNVWKVTKVRLTLTAPPAASVANAQTRYDILTYVHLP